MMDDDEIRKMKMSWEVNDDYHIDDNHIVDDDGNNHEKWQWFIMIAVVVCMFVSMHACMVVYVYVCMRTHVNICM